jgi:hypothetical protein
MDQKVRVLAGVSLVSAHVLALELALTRFFSVGQGYHYAFLVVSIAFLGFGAGSLLLFWERLEKLSSPENFFSRVSLLISFSVLISFFLVNRFSFNPVELLWNQSRIWLLPVHFIILSFPFFLGGLIISSALTFFPDIVHKTYFADLIGAASGIILSALSFRLAGDRGAVLLLILMPILSSWLFSSRRNAVCKSKFFHLGSSLGILLIFVSFSQQFSFRISEYKPLPFYLKQKDAVLEKTFWDEKIRLDLFLSPSIRYAPGLSLKFPATIPEQVGLSLDAERTFALLKSWESPDQLTFLDFLPISGAFRSISGKKVLLIQPESDLEILLSLKNGARQITVLEGNSLIRKVHESQITSLPESRIKNCQIFLKTVEPRAGLLREKSSCDLIVFPLPDLPGSFSTGFFGPGEDYLMTEEAFMDMFNLLGPKGMVAALFYYLPPLRQELRFLSTWIDTLEKLGLKPQNHIIILRSVETITFFVGKTPFSEEELNDWKNFTAYCFFDLLYPADRAGRSEESFIHYGKDSPDQLLIAMFDQNRRQEIRDRYIFEISPPTDDKPFFRDFFKWSRWRQTLNFFNRKMYPLFLGKYLLLFLFVQALVLGLVIIIIPLLRISHFRLKKVPNKSLIFLYFASLGLGYMLVEITLFHKFILLLGHPTYSLSAVLLFMLSSSGAGSLSLVRLENKIKQTGLIFWPLICSTVVFFEIFILNLCKPFFLSLSLPLRFGFSLLLIFPLGFCLGIPFPSGLKFFSLRSRLITPLAFATNSFFSLLASPWGLLQASALGYKSVFYLAGSSYLLSFLFFYFASHGNKPDIE